MTNNFKAAAKELVGAFSYGKRNSSGETYIFLRSGSPEWMQEAVRAAHGDRLPSDWIYAACQSAAQDIATEDAESARDWAGGRLYFWADGEVDIGDANALAWGGDNYALASEAEAEAEADLGKIDGTAAKRMQVAQYYAASAIGRTIAEALQDRAEALEAAAAGEEAEA